MDLNKIKGQEHCKRALEVAAVGRHGVLMIGPKGAGKTKFMKAFAGIVDRELYAIDDLQEKRASAVLTDVSKLNNKILCVTMLPCPCGNFTDPKKECTCTPLRIQNYLGRLPIAVLDRVDIHIEIPKLNLTLLNEKRCGESSDTVLWRIVAARKNLKPTACDKEADELLKLAILELGISARAYDKILRVAGTIAQMDGKAAIEVHHISEAISYRSLDRNLWG